MGLQIICRPLQGQEEDAARTIFAHLKISDPKAVDVAKALVEEYPESNMVRFAYLQTLAEKGDEAAVFQEWNLLKPDFQKDRHALEVLAWSVLKKGEHSSQVHIHLASVIGAALTRDARAIPMLVSALRSSSAFLRLFGIRFALQLGDTILQEEIARLIEEEQVWFVRKEAIRAVGALRLTRLRPHLVKIVANSQTLAEERAEAILSLVGIYDGVRKDDLQKLLNDPRAGLRQLACELIGYYELYAETSNVKKLLHDASSDVRQSALRALHILHKKIETEDLKALMEDLHPAVSITASWVACHQGNTQGVETLKKWILGSHPHSRRLAAAMLPRCGEIASALVLEALQSHSDPFVVANLALSLIQQRKEVEKACQKLGCFFHHRDMGRLMWENVSSCQVVAPNTVYHIEHIQNYPEMIDQLTRLDLLNLLCILKYPQAQEAVKEFIQNKTEGPIHPSIWGVAEVATLVVLQEGDEEASRLVQELLESPEIHIRAEAALILAIYGNDPKAVKVLEKVYSHVDREMKVRILEAVGHVGGFESIPFLIDVLGGPFQLLRVVAASAMIQCLYH